jgi:hypothetical protein
MHPIVVDAFPTIENKLGIRIWRDVAATTTAALRRRSRTFARVLVRRTAIRASLDVADAAIAAVVVSLTLITAPGTNAPGI